MPAERWTATCPAQKEVVKRIECDITNDSVPKPTYEKYAVFKAHTLSTFRSHLGLEKRMKSLS